MRKSVSNSLKSFEQTNFGDWQSEKMQSNTADFARQFELVFPFFNGVLLKDITLSATPQDIAHKLNRTPNGYVIIKRSSAGVVYSDSTNTNDKFIRLTASSSVTVNIWIF